MDLFSRNTMQVAEYLAQHAGIEQVHYLGLPATPSMTWRAGTSSWWTPSTTGNTASPPTVTDTSCRSA